MPEGAKGSYDEGEAKWPKGTSTRTRLHELGHKELGHVSGDKYLDEIAREELDAEIYAWEKMGKSINHRVGLAPMGSLEDYGAEDEEALRSVVKMMRLKGIKVGKAEMEDLRSIVSR